MEVKGDRVCYKEDVVRGLIRRAWAKAKALWQRAKSERAEPHQIGWAVGVGVFAACTPALGFHGPLALGLATLFRLNRLWAWIGSRLSNVITLPLVVYAEVQVAHRVRTGQWLAIDRTRLVAAGADVASVNTAAHAAGITRPLLYHVPAEDDQPFGGW